MTCPDKSNQSKIAWFYFDHTVNSNAPRKRIETSEIWNGYLGRGSEEDL